MSDMETETVAGVEGSEVRQRRMPKLLGGIRRAGPFVLGVLAALVAFLLYDALDGRWRELRVPRDPACPVCGSQTSATT